MAVYANGRAPESALVLVDGVLMVPSIAPRVRALMAAAEAAGVIIRPHRLGGYRDLAAQQVEYERGAAGGSTVKPAKPGQSTHGDFLVGRVDLVGADGYTYTRRELDWMVDNAGRFGLVREFGAADPNHFKAGGSFAGDIDEFEENDMGYPIGIRRPDGALAVLNDSAPPEFPGGDYPVWERVYGFGWLDVSDDDWDAAVVWNYKRAAAASSRPVIQHPNGAISEIGEFSVTRHQGERAYKGASMVQTGVPTGFRRVTAEQFADEEARVAQRRANLIADIARQIGGGSSVDPAALAASLAPKIVEAISSEVVSDEDLAKVRDEILAAIAKLPDEQLAALGLQRRAS